MTDTRRPLLRRDNQPNYWKGSRSQASIPDLALVTDLGEPILTDLGQYIIAKTS
jgi:hypothetical protein